MSANKHIFPPVGLGLPNTLHEDKHKLEKADVPVITVSGTFRGEISKYFGEKVNGTHEAVFSRAHYSMAVSVMVEARRRNLTTWLVDPTNYVSKSDWKKVRLVERIGQLIARISLLKDIKDFVDSFARSKFPLRESIREPLLYVIKRCVNPVIAMHYEAGNIIAAEGKSVVSVVTDPYVHETYLYEAMRDNISFAVFDTETKTEFLSKASKLNVKVDESRIVVTGPPVDPRIIAFRKNKNPTDYKKRGLRLVIATSGLGTNKSEIESLVTSIFQNLNENKIELILHASTHEDFRKMYYSLAEKYGIEIGSIDSSSQVRVIYKSNIVDVNQDLIDYAFGWADGFVTKPSGDMAYDAAAAGCFILSLNPWGVWEENIEKIFSKLEILKKAEIHNFDAQLKQLHKTAWYEKAIRNSLNLDKSYLEGAKKIVDLQQRLAIQ